MFLESLGDSGEQCEDEFECLGVLVVEAEGFVEEGEELAEVNELVVDVLDDEVHLAGLLEQLDDLVESVCSYLEVALSVLLVATRKYLRY